MSIFRSLGLKESRDITVLYGTCSGLYHTNLQWVYVVYGKMYTCKCHVRRGRDSVFSETGPRKEMATEMTQKQCNIKQKN